MPETTTTTAPPIDRGETFVVPAQSSRQTWWVTLNVARIRERRETRRQNESYRARMYGTPVPQRADTRA